jgi:hypothetical protein
MAVSDMISLDQLRAERDRKLQPVINDRKPVWVIDLNHTLDRSELVFELVFRPYPNQGWFRRRYRYDGQVDVLHHIGEVALPESELSSLPQAALIEE